MAEYIEREAVKKALLGWDYDPSDDDVECAINHIPTADVVEVVRCKDCEYFNSVDYNINKCEEHSDGWGDHTVYVGEDDYCSFGIRKEGAEE